MTAKFLRDIPGFRGHAALYELSTPLAENKFVIVSATDPGFGCGPETLIFPASESGSVSDWGELDGSLSGTLSHAAALLDAGYTIDTNTN